MDIASFLIGLQAGQNKAGGGSGGGSLPAGLYWETVTPTWLSTYSQAWFMLGGYLHSWHSIDSGSGFKHKISKLVDGVWTEVVGEHSVGSLASAACIVPVVIGDTVHFMGNDSKKHITYTYGDTEVIHKTDLESAVYSGGACCHNGKLMAYFRSLGGVYIWDEDTDTWTLDGTLANNTHSNYQPVSCGDDLYFIYSKNVYKYADGALTLVGTLQHSSGTNFVFHNGCIWNICSSSYRYYVQRYDLSTNICEYVGLAPVIGNVSVATLHVWDNQIHLVEVYESYRHYYDMVMHVVEASE